MRRQIQIGLAAAAAAAVLAGCLDAPARGGPPFAPDAGVNQQPDPGDDPGGGGAVQACSLSVTYASEFHVVPEQMLVDGFAVIGNAGDTVIDIRDLEIADVFTQTNNANITFDLEVSLDTLPPGEGHGALDDEAIAEVAPALEEAWTDTDAPTLSLVFDPDGPFTSATAVIALSLRDTNIPLTVTFRGGPPAEPGAVRSERVVAACP
ncbi:MAG TPA: hypothetical protein VMZ28_06440 [Kofleriaceae bacterium]|nr:hypothetical protein [Kofleriaceae bacterium]